MVKRKILFIPDPIGPLPDFSLDFRGGQSRIIRIQAPTDLFLEKPVQKPRKLNDCGLGCIRQCDNP